MSVDMVAAAKSVGGLWTLFMSFKSWSRSQLLRPAEACAYALFRW
jgi:hypothetical protein